MVVLRLCDDVGTDFMAEKSDETILCFVRSMQEHQVPDSRCPGMMAALVDQAGLWSENHSTAGFIQFILHDPQPPLLQYYHILCSMTG